MEPKIIVMIVTLAMPNGDAGVHVKPMFDAVQCQEEADIEASDPFVRAVECSELTDGSLTLKFDRLQPKAQPATDDPERTG